MGNMGSVVASDALLLAVSCRCTAAAVLRDMTLERILGSTTQCLKTGSTQKRRLYTAAAGNVRRSIG